MKTLPVLVGRQVLNGLLDFGCWSASGVKGARVLRMWLCRTTHFEFDSVIYCSDSFNFQQEAKLVILPSQGPGRFSSEHELCSSEL